MTSHEPYNKEGVTKRRTLERAKRVTRRRGASKRAKHHGHGDVSCYLDAACFAKLFVLHIVRDERHTRQRKMNGESQVNDKYVKCAAASSWRSL